MVRIKKTRSVVNQDHQKRNRFLLMFFAAILILLSIRLGYLHIVERDFLQKEGFNRTLRTITEPAARGMIFSQDGELLAGSAQVANIAIDPEVFLRAVNYQFSDNYDDCLANRFAHSNCSWLLEDLDRESARKHFFYQKLEKLSELLEIPVEVLYQDLMSKSKSRFFYLAREVKTDVLNQVMALNLRGIIKENTYKRFYPLAEKTSQIVGFTNSNQAGLEGIEAMYDPILTGISGKSRVLRDNLGKIHKVVDEELPASAGQDVYLSINSRIQKFLLDELSSTAQQFQAKSVSAVVLDVKTGEILAMGSYPFGDANDKAQRVQRLMRNRAALDVIEPGSVIKPIAIAAAIESGALDVNQIFKLRSPYVIGRNKVTDTHYYPELDAFGIIKKSSNVGMALISQNLSRQYYQDFLHKMGFGEKTNLGLMGEPTGVVRGFEKKGDFSFATTTYGYGISMTVLQIAHAYATIANDGVKVPLSLTKVNPPIEGERVISEKTAKIVQQMLVGVVESGGTGTNAASKIYSTAGKTGTAIKNIADKNKPRLYRGLFAGFAPVNQPKISVVVVVDEPKGKFYGGTVAAPAFRSIVEKSLNVLGIFPDKLPDHQMFYLTSNALTNAP